MQTTLQILSQAEREQVHERTLRVLARVGVRCDTSAGRRILAEAGARVDESSGRVRFPADLVERSLAAAAKRY
ncbi:MAG TPA: trimethylamine methyltransferase family protein, partial [Thermoleophilia bacterium]|nr:trimethylamine methyltransferase family protein [Thermoleophilia bacterium]